jgi:hypothetical protein
MSKSNRYVELPFQVSFKPKIQDRGGGGRRRTIVLIRFRFGTGNVYLTLTLANVYNLSMYEASIGAIVSKFCLLFVVGHCDHLPPIWAVVYYNSRQDWV